MKKNWGAAVSAFQIGAAGHREGPWEAVTESVQVGPTWRQAPTPQHGAPVALGSHREARPAPSAPSALSFTPPPIGRCVCI